MTDDANNEDTNTSEWAPSDPLDGRALGEWESRYKPIARTGIRIETSYLVVLLFLPPLFLLLFWLKWPNQYLALQPARYALLCRGVYITCGGLLGGTLFAMKWLYHSVAKGMWHEDRRLWRLLSPVISAGLSFAIGLIIASDLFDALSPNSISTTSGAFAVGFLVGYFSDSALAKLAEVARSLFGASEQHRPRPASHHNANNAKPE